MANMINFSNKGWSMDNTKKSDKWKLIMVPSDGQVKFVYRPIYKTGQIKIASKIIEKFFDLQKDITVDK